MFVKNKKIFFLVFLGIFLIAFPVLALELDWPPSPGPDHIILTISTPLPELVQYFYEWGIALGGLAAFIVFIFAGFQYLTSVGDPPAMKEAMERIRSALLGLVLLLGSWLILNTINPELTTLRLPDTNLAETGQLECDIPTDCSDPAGYKCSDPCPSGCAITTSPYCEAKIPACKEGVCIKNEENKKVCASADIFGSDDYDNLLGTINVDEEKKWFAQSVKVKTVDGIDCCDDAAYKGGYYGCGCSLQVFAGTWYTGSTCTDLEVIVPGCEKNIMNYTDKTVSCVKLMENSL